MTFALALPSLARLLRTPRSWAAIAAWTLVGVASALVVRSRGTTTGADHVMRGTFGVIVLPLVAFAIVGAALGGGGMKRSIRGVVALGAAPRAAAFASTLVAVAASMVIGAVVASITCAVAHGSGDPPLGRDLFASLWIGGLGGGAYAAYFAAGSALGQGTMRSGLLVVDWIVGGAGGVGAIFVPRGHVTSLLGGPLAAEIPQRASSVLLVVLLVAYTGLAVALSRRV